jgi:hypothetical protein
MIKKQPAIGFDRKMKLRWLNAIVGWLASGIDREEIICNLNGILTSEGQGKAAQKKTKTVLLGIWVKVPTRIEGFRDDGIELFNNIADSDRLALHWGMCMAAYPFFGAVSANLGRLFRLQDKVATTQIHRRLREQYGDREIVTRAAQHVVSTLYSWNILNDTGSKSVCLPPAIKLISNPRLGAWLLESVLLSRGKDSDSLKTLINTPSLFPFEIDVASSIAAFSPRVEVIRHGLDEDLLRLKKCR